MPTITIIEPCNFSDYPTGGQLTFARNVLAALSNNIILVGISTDHHPVGRWFTLERNGDQHRFFAFMKGTRKPGKPFIPMRIKVYFKLLLYRKRILAGCSKIVFIQSPEVLLAFSKFKHLSIIYRFAGVENPLLVSRYPYAKYLARLYDWFFLPQAAKASKVLVTSDSKGVKELCKRSNGRLNKNKVVPFPTRIDGAVFIKSDSAALRNKLSINANATLVLTCGRLGRYKGWKLMIDAFALFEKQHGNSLFYVIGDGEDQSKIRQYISERLFIHTEDLTAVLHSRATADPA